MRRRDILRLCGGVALWPVSAHAQQTTMHRVAYVAAIPPLSQMIGGDPINPFARAFLHGLRSLGYVEGQNLVMEWRSAEGRFERVPEIIRELCSINVDVIVATTLPIVRAAKAVTRTVPIVMTGIGNPVEGSLRASPGPVGTSLGLPQSVAMKTLRSGCSC